MEKRGLTELEARKNLQRYGHNEIVEISKKSTLNILLRQVKNNFIIYLLLVAVIISFFVGKSITAYVITAVIFMVVVIGFVQEYKAERALNALKNMIMPVSIVIRDGKEKEVFSQYLVPGDILILRSGEKIPADCFVIDGNEVFVNESVLTGESKEVKKESLKKNQQEYLENNMLFMGSFIVNGRCTAKIINTGMRTRFGKIAGMISTAEKELPLQKKVNRIAKYMAAIAIIVAVLTGLMMIWRAESLTEGFLIEVLILTIALAVSAFPEGLPVVLITTLASGAYKMAKQNAIVNRMSVIETLGETTVICSDKTGTITKGEMTVKKIFFDNILINVTGTGYEATGDFFYDKRKINISKEPVLDLLLKTSITCNDSRIERIGDDNIYRTIGNPTEAALLIMAAKAGIFKEDIKFERIDEVPFNSDRKIMSVSGNYNSEGYIFIKGAPEIILQKSKFIQKSNGVFSLTSKDRKTINEVNTKMTSETFRTLAFAYKKINFSRDKITEEEIIFLGLVGMQDPPREGVKEAIKICMKAGIKVKMITGDNRETAIAIAREIELNGNVIEGYELDNMTDDKLRKVINEITIFARVRPEHKLRIIKALKSNEEIVTMTGDGVNDAPALKEAHIGVAMGKGGTDVSREVADLILKDDDFTTIVSAVKEGRTIFTNTRKFVTYQLSCNFAELSILFFGVLLAPFFGWQIPILLALQILFMNLVTDNFPALTLGFNPSSSDVMEEKPRRKTDILNKNMIISLVVTGSILTILVLGVFYINYNLIGNSFEYSRTVALVSLIFLEIASAFNFRSFRKGVLYRSLLVNKYLFYASLISITATILIIYTPLKNVFETTNISFAGWAISIAVAFLLIIIFDLFKRLNAKYKIMDLEHI